MSTAITNQRTLRSATNNAENEMAAAMRSTKAAGFGPAGGGGGHGAVKAKTMGVSTRSALGNLANKVIGTTNEANRGQFQSE